MAESLAKHMEESEQSNKLEKQTQSFVSSAHSTALMQELGKIKKAGLLCDVTLCIADLRLPAHKLVLSASSPFFAAMFSSRMKESESGCVKLRNVEPSAVKDLVDFAYSSHISFSLASVMHLIAAADMLQFAEIKQACCNFLQNHVTPTNCLELLRLSDAHSCSQLHQAALLCRNVHFEAVSRQQSFLELPLGQLERCLSSDHLRVSDEAAVLEAAISWLDHGAGSRSVHAPRVLGCVRLSLLPPSVLLDKVWGHKMVSASPQCMELVRRALSVHISPATTGPPLEQVV